MTISPERRLKYKDLVTRLMFVTGSREITHAILTNALRKSNDLQTEKATVIYELLETFPRGVIANERHN